MYTLVGKYWRMYICCIVVEMIRGETYMTEDLVT